MSRAGQAAGSIVLIYLAIALFALVSWIKNIYHLTQLDWKDPYKAEIIRGIAIPVGPMSMITAWIDIGEEGEPEPVAIPAEKTLKEVEKKVDKSE